MTRRRAEILIGTLVLSACAWSPDLSTPEKAAAAFAEAVNSGSMAKFEAVVGADAFAAAVKQCEEWKQGPTPAPPQGLGGLQKMAQLLYDEQMAKRSQNCSEIRQDLAKRLAAMPGGPGIRVLRVGREATKDGQAQAVVRYSPPGWNGDQDRVDMLLFAKDAASGRWRPVSLALPSGEAVVATGAGLEATGAEGVARRQACSDFAIAVSSSPARRRFGRSRLRS